ncbi:MAG: heme biosynthesis HemY N-terminal domain-containing protein [Francisellaceae bacterium]
MRKILTLIILVIIAAVASWYIVHIPALIVLIVSGYIIKMPLWLFVLLVITALCLLIFIIRCGAVLIGSPRQFFSFWRRRRFKKFQALLNSWIKDDAMGNSEVILKSYRSAFGKDRRFGESLSALYWKALLAEEKWSQLSTALEMSQHQKTPLWQYYHIHLLVGQQRYEQALEMVKQIADKRSVFAAMTVEILLAMKRDQEALSLISEARLKWPQAKMDDLIHKAFDNCHDQSSVAFLWQQLDKSMHKSTSVICAYASALERVGLHSQALHLIKKQLPVTIDYQIVSTLFRIVDDDGSYKLVRQHYDKQSSVDEKLWLLILSRAVIYEDWGFIAAHIHDFELKSIDDKARHHIIEAMWCEHESMHNKAKMLLDHAHGLLLAP